MKRAAVWTGLLSTAVALPMLGGMMLTASATPSDKVRICHATSSESNPYTNNNVNTSSVDEANNQYLNGHGDHARDIIPPFESPAGTVFDGKNWPDGKAIWENDCKVATPPNEPSPTPTETTASPTPTTTKTPREETPTPTPTETTPTPTPPANPTPSGSATVEGSPSPSQSTPVASTSPTPEPSTPAASKTPKSSASTPPATKTTPKPRPKSNPPTTIPSQPKSPATPLPKCTDVAQEMAGKTYEKDSPQATGIRCE